MSGNRIFVKTLDLNVPFEKKEQLDSIYIDNRLIARLFLLINATKIAFEFE